MQPNFFSNGSPFLKHPLLTPDRARQEIEFIENHVQLPHGARVLDVGCGFGRHAIELAQRDYEVVAIDPASAMIRAAEQRATRASVNIDFRVGLGETMTFNTPFDAIICLFTTLGQIEQGQEDNRALLGRCFQALKPGGKFFIEIPQREVMVANLKATERFGSDTQYTRIERAYDESTRIVYETFAVVSPGSSRYFRLAYHLFSANEIVELLEFIGFDIIGQYDGYRPAPLTPNSPTMVFVAQHP